MNHLRKVLFGLSILVLGVWILFPLLRWTFDLEFATDAIKSEYTAFMFYAVPIAALGAFLGTIRAKDSGASIAKKILAGIVVSIIAAVVMVVSMFTDMCAWSNREVLYERKIDPNTKIIVRDFGCGATDSGSPSKGVYKVEYFTEYFIRSTSIDTADIDKIQWTRIE